MKLDKYKKSFLRLILNFLRDDYLSWKVFERLSFNQKKFERELRQETKMSRKGRSRDGYRDTFQSMD